jgi:hypothetical protein
MSTNNIIPNALSTNEKNINIQKEGVKKRCPRGPTCYFINHKCLYKHPSNPDIFLYNIICKKGDMCLGKDKICDFDHSEIKSYNPFILPPLQTFDKYPNIQSRYTINSYDSHPNHFTIDPPRRPIDPPGYAIDPPRRPIDPPGCAIDPPRRPIDPPGYVIDPPRRPIDPPGYVIDPPRRPIDPPGYAIDPPRRPINPPGYAINQQFRPINTSNKLFIPFDSTINSRSLNISRDRSNSRDRPRHRDRSSSRDRPRHRDRSRSRDRPRHRDRSRSRDINPSFRPREINISEKKIVDRNNLVIPYVNDKISICKNGQKCHYFRREICHFMHPSQISYCFDLYENSGDIMKTINTAKDFKEFAIKNRNANPDLKNFNQI